MTSYLKLTGSFEDLLDVGVREVGLAGVGVLQKHSHHLAVHPLQVHTLLVALPQAIAKHRPERGGQQSQAPA